MANTSAGQVLRTWRKEKGYSQLRLATEAEVSTRHLSCVETGRAQPSRQLLLILASALELPLRERNVLLRTAGFTPAYSDAGLEHASMKKVREAIKFILAQHEPFPVVVFDRHWRITHLNAGALRVFGRLAGPFPPGADALELLFSDKALGPHLINFDQVVTAILGRVREEARQDPTLARRLKEVVAMLPDGWKQPPLGDVPDVLVPIRLRYEGQELSLFSTLTTLGTPSDATAQELRIETYFPADESSRRLLEDLAKA